MIYGTGFDGIDGIAGMSTGLGPYSEGPILIQELYKDGKIEAPIFGWYLAGMDDQSYLDIGSIQNDAMRDPSELVWLDVIDDDFWWTNLITGVKFETADGKSETEYSVEMGYALTDTGTSCVYVPEKYFPAFIEEIQNNA